MLGTSAGVAELEGSVGGHVDVSARVQAIVDWYGPVDFLLRSRTQPKSNLPGSSSFGLLGGAPSEKTELARLASPVTHVTADDPPLLILHGDRDTKVLPNQSERLRDVYTAAGLDVTLHMVPGGQHNANPIYFTGDKRRLVAEFHDYQSRRQDDAA